MTNSANRLFDATSERILSETWEHYPSMASRLGLHEYDGRLPSVSARAIAARTGQVRNGLAALESIDTTALSARSYYDHRILTDNLRRELLELTELRWHETNPMEMMWHIDMSAYIQRDYAPLEQRVESLVQALTAVPTFMAELRYVMSGRLASPVLEASIEAFDGIVDFYQRDLVDATKAVRDDGLQARFEDARSLATVSVREFVEHLKALRPYADASFAIGGKRFAALLEYGEMVDLPLEQLLNFGEADLKANMERFVEVAALVDADKSPAEVMAEIASDHPAAGALIPETRDMLEDIRQYIICHDIVSVPSEVRCQTVPTPSFMRWAFAALDFPGPYEQNADETFYYVTPVEEHWSNDEKEQWMTSFNYATLRAVSVHEAYPGHYIHYLHTMSADSMISRAFGAYSFWEGWAHYTEQMMVEAGYLSDPRSELGQLMEALMRNCRYICAIKMHTQGMTIDEATRFFIGNAFMEELPASKEAIRGTFDPMYLNYTLGKLMILKLREDYRQAKGDAYTLRQFHDEFLSHGAPPIPLVREMMLGEDSGDVL
ncbi:MAG: DUF885 domain-containing protein [Chloroflexota bacterium]|nr:DUF885 domain-containing protein [Chloroflexota bacterium]